MNKVSANYYKSCSIPSVVRGSEIKPYFKIISIQGSSRIKYVHFSLLNGLSEPKIYYVIAKNQPYLNKINILNNWRSTANFPVDNKIFNEEVELSIPYCELFEYCHLLIVLSNYFVNSHGFVEEKYTHACYLSLYNSHDVFRRGIYELEMHPLDQKKFSDLDSTLQIVNSVEFNGKPKSIIELNRLLKVMRKKLRNQLPNCPMDKTSLAQVSQRIDQLKKSAPLSTFITVSFQFTKDIDKALPVVLTRPMSVHNTKAQKNPVEKKYYCMTRNAREINADRMRKPNTDDLNEIKRILKQPPNTTMTDSQSDLIWMYRYYISDVQPTAISKVMSAVKWDYQGHTDQVTDILLKWPLINPEYLIELLTSNFINSSVRKFAVRKFSQASDDDLMLYLFQMVQALRYEDFSEIQSIEPGQEKVMDNECSNQNAPLCTLLSSLDQSKSMMNSMTNANSLVNQIIMQDDLASFLIRRCQNCRKLASYFYWFLKLESENSSHNSAEVCNMFSHVLSRFREAMDRGDLYCRENWSNITAQINFVEYLTRLVKILSQNNLKVAQKTPILRDELRKYLEHIPQFSLPLNADFVVKTIDIDNSFVLKSSLAPIKLCLISTNDERYDIIFKDGDDLRQDQVVLQMIAFMNEILLRENFDMKLTPYQVLATSTRSGFIEFIKSKSISEVQAEHTSISNYLRSVAPRDNDPDQIDESVLDTYARSLAGYCVITYLLGVGDRHLDNIMLSGSTGHFFHIDFGFVLGNDPKPLPPEVRLTKDMIDVLSEDQRYFQKFCDYTFNTFNYLRRHANQCLSLLSLISDAGIQDFNAASNSSSASTACDFLRERFLLDASDEECVDYLASRITSSLKAIIPGIMEMFHKFAMKFK